MTLGQASDLLDPFLKNPRFDSFFEKTSRLKELREEISKVTSQMKPTNVFADLYHEVLPKETEKLFREYIDICKRGLTV